VRTYCFLLGMLAASVAALWIWGRPRKSLAIFSSSQSRRVSYGLAFVLAILTLVTFCQDLDLRAATGDEISHAQNALGEPYYDFDTKNIVVAAALHHQPPLDYIASAISLRIFGRNEFGARLPAVLFAALALAALFLLLSELGVRFVSSFLTVSFFGTSSIFVVYATDGRPYSLAILTSIVFLNFALRVCRSNDPKEEILVVVSSGILFLFSIGMQPVYMFATLLLVSPILSGFRWKNVKALAASVGAILFLGSPVLSLIGERAKAFAPNRSLDVFLARLRSAPSALAIDWSTFWAGSSFGTAALQIVGLGLVLLLAGIAQRHVRFQKNSDSVFGVLPSTLFGLLLAIGIYFFSITATFVILIDYEFLSRHAILTFSLAYILLGLTFEAGIRLAGSLGTMGSALSVSIGIGLILIHANQFALFQKHIRHFNDGFGGRAAFRYLKSIPGTVSKDWSANGYALDIVHSSQVDFSGFYGQMFYAKSDFPPSITVTQTPKPNLPIWFYLLEDVRSGRQPTEMIFYSIYPYFGLPSALSLKSVPWSTEDGVSIEEFPWVLITRVSVKGSLIETAIKFFDKVGKSLGHGREMTLVHETRSRLYLEKGDCKSAELAFLEVQDESLWPQAKSLEELLKICENRP
jgi:hypothetical protein